MASSTRTTPFAETISRVNDWFVGRGLNGVHLLPTPTTDGWISPSALLANDGDGIGERLTRLAKNAPEGDRAIPAYRFLSGYGWRLIHPAIVAYRLTNRLPDLSRDNLRFHYEANGWADGVAYVGERFIGISGDPAAGHDDVEIAPNIAALRERLRTDLIAHLDPVVKALHARSRLGERTLWRSAADIIAAALIRYDHNRADVSDELEAILRTAERDSPFYGRTGVLKIAVEGERRYYMNRGSCCFDFYGRPDRRLCVNCPLIPLDERIGAFEGFAAADIAKSRETAST